MRGFWYLDSSALVKLVLTEPESGRLETFLGEDVGRVSSALASVELIRAVRAHGDRAIAEARKLLGAIDLIPLDEPLLDRAGSIGPPALRSLDAIHVATAEACLANSPRW